MTEFHHNSAERDLLKSAGPTRGSRTLVMAMVSQGGMLARVGDRWVHLAEKVAAKILVSVSVEPEESMIRVGVA